MPYLHIIDGVPTVKTAQEVSLYLRRDRNVSCRDEPDAANLAEFNIFPLDEGTKPVLGADEVAVETAPAQANGVWVRQWSVAQRPVRTSLTPHQFKKRLEAKNRWAAFKTYVGALTPGDQMEWVYADVIKRDSPLITALQTATGLTNNQIDAVFRV